MPPVTRADPSRADRGLAEIPFPIERGRYEVLPAMKRLGDQPILGKVEAGHFVADADLARYLAEKLRLLEGWPEAVRCVDPEHEPAGLAEAVWRVFDLVAAEHPELVRPTGDGVVLPHLGLALEGDRRAPAVRRVDPKAPLADLGARAARHLEGVTGIPRLADALALTMMEDYALVAAGTAAPGDPGDRAELLHVAFPGHWDPRTKVGRDFTAIHRPVAHNEVITGAHPSLVRAMVEKGPFVRFVWGLVTDDHLAHNPNLPGGAREPVPAQVLADPEALAARTYFRVERQTTHPFPDLGRALFTIRVYLAPLAGIAADPARRAQLASALEGMDAAAQAYKGVTELRAPLLTWLRAATPRGGLS